mgnify:FL=1
MTEQILQFIERLLLQILMGVSAVVFSFSLSADDDTATIKHIYDWGDLGTNYYANPILPSDYSDIDVIRVNGKFYMISSEFHFMGMPVLESDDMINWHIVSQVYNTMPLEGYYSMEKFGEGTWAPSIRYHNGLYYIYVCTPKEGVFVSTAKDPHGPWSKIEVVQAAVGWQDPCPYWDANGKAYLVRGIVGGGEIYVHKMSADGKKLLDDGVKVYSGPVAQGAKVYHRGRSVYIALSEGGAATGWLKVLRGSNILGPFKGKRVFEKGTTSIRGLGEGAFVETASGDWWYYHFQQIDPQGRILHLQPTTWEDGFPLVGKDYDGNGVGEPVARHKKPILNEDVKPCAPQHSDHFDGPKLGLQWQSNHNAAVGHISLWERPGWLMIRSLPSMDLRLSRNQLSQKLIGYNGRASVIIDKCEMVEGQRAGMECIGKRYNGAGVYMMKRGKDVVPWVYFDYQGNVELVAKIPDGCDQVHIKLEIDATENVFCFYYSFDGKTFKPCGRSFPQGSADYKGARIGMYTYSTTQESGNAYFDDFTYEIDGPGFLFKKEE